ncbi:flagellar hook-length control protein FliK [Ensifer sp. MJa1]|uniref:flagellar hook-length control protein FliK n=1 Tax=Ensifer sp. MJa1 TaxID=2919888 RepID=UPI003009815C
MRALDDSLRGLPPAPAGMGNGRAGSKDQAGGLLGGAFEDAVANAGRQKGNDQAGAGGGEAGDDPGTGDMIDRDNIAKTMVRKAHGVAQRLAAITQGETSFAERANGQLPALGREVNAHRLAESKIDTTKAGKERSSSADPVDQEGLAERIVALSKGLSKVSASGQAEAADELDASNGGEGAEATPRSEMDDLLTLLGGGQTPAIARGGVASAADQNAAGGQGTGIGASGASGEQAGKADVPSGEGEPDRLFRFARADGKGQNISMSLSRDGEATFDSSRQQTSSKVENVTVLEARRYLGIAMNANSSAVTDAIAGEAATQSLQPSAALAQPGAWTQAGKTLNTLKIQLHPIELGLVTATLRLKDDELQVELKVETGDAFRQLRDDQGEMVKALRAQGFAVDQVNIVFNSGGDASTGNGSQAQAQAGQQGRERADGNGQQGRQQQRDGGQASMTERWGGNGGTDDATAGTERARTGHVYM